MKFILLLCLEGQSITSGAGTVLRGHCPSTNCNSTTTQTTKSQEA